MTTNNKNKEIKPETKEIAGVFKEEEIAKIEEESILIEGDILNFGLTEPIRPDVNPENKEKKK